MFTHSETLTILTHTPPETLKPFADDLIPYLGAITVLQNRTGLVMLPYTDTAEGTVFHLGEVLVSEGHIRIEGGAEGYGMVLGRDVEFALAVAVVDAALTAGIETERITAFIKQQAAVQAEADRDEARKVESTRVEMETF